MRGQLTVAAFGLAAMLAAVSAPAAAQIAGAGDVERTTAELEEAAADTTSGSDADPWEGFNRQSFKVYLFFDDYFLVPAAKGYRAVTTKKSRKGIRNFLSNIQSANILFNDLLQGEFKRAGQTTGRFLINSTIGFGGFADPASKIGIPHHSEDFGQTLAVWGAPSGPFMFMPIFGPSTIRDGVGLGVDFAADPLVWLRSDAAAIARYSRFGMTAISRREPLIEPLEDIERTSLDYYASLRSFYMQARKREIANGRTTFEDLPDIGEYEEFDEVQ
ncbi:MAG: VacJ family lipoprotein [Parvularculaceae bacterium]